VFEIDGQATPVEDSTPPAAGEADATEASGRADELRGLQIEDRADEIVVAALDNRRRQVACGSTVVFTVSILNNGAHAGLFEVQVEGWLDPAWLGDTTAAVLLEPGARATLRLPLCPPRRSESEAGDYHFAVSVRSPQYPGHSARLGALLTVLPFDAVELRLPLDDEPVVSWFKRAAVLPLTVVNRSNHSVVVDLAGHSLPGGCRIAFAAPANAGGGASVPLQPNQAVKTPVRVEIPRPPLLGLHGRDVGVQITARVRGPADSPLAATHTNLLARPLVGPWQIVAGVGVAAVAAVGLLLFVALLYVLTQRTAPVTVSAPPTPLPAAPPVIIVNLNQPAVAPVGGSTGGAGASGSQAVPGAPGAIISDFTTGTAPDPALPLVLPDQVSTPGGAVPAAAGARRPETAGGAPGEALAFDPAAAASADPAPAADANQTYGQMFQEVGQRFDLDWRMLAAQAYIESGFDSLALSDAGAMGLMQVLPNTWREWAAPVEVSDPFDAYSNVLVAAVYLDHLRSQLAAKGYPGTEWMLVAYNWGPDRVNDFLAGGGTWDTLPQARRQYATEILRIAKTIP
jgi:hypothetical protein